MADPLQESGPWDSHSAEPWKNYEAPPEPEGIPEIEGEPIARMTSPGIPSAKHPVPEMEEPIPAFRERKAEMLGFGEVPEKHQRNFNRLKEMLGFTPGRPEDQERIVEMAFGDDAELKFHKGFGEHVIEFKTGEVVPFDALGLGSEQDRRGLRAGAGVLLSEVSAGAAGFGAGLATAGPPGGFVVGALSAPIGAGLGRYQALQQGKAAGAHDLSESEILGEAAQEYALSLGGELLGGAGAAVYRRFLGSPEAKRMLGELTEEQIDDAIAHAEDLNRRTVAATGEDLGATTGQVVTQVAPEAGRKIQTFERGLEARGAEVGAGARESQKAAEEAVKIKMLGEAPESLEEALPFGEAVQDVAEGNLGKAREQIVRSAHEERAEAIAKQLDIADAPPTLTSAEGVRTWMKDARKKTFDQLSNKYKKFWEGVPDVEVDLSGLRETATKWHGVLKKDIFKSMTEEDVKLVREAMEAGLGEGKEGTFDQVSRAISTLKAEQRLLKDTPGFAKSRESKLLNDFISELDAARDAALKGVDPALRKQLDDLDAAYRVAKEKIDLSLINRMITKKKGGGFKISDDKLFDTILRNPSEARNIAAIISNPDYVAFNTSEGIRKGIMGSYRDKVIDGTTTHKSFMNQHGASIKEFFTPQEMRRFDSLEKATAMIRLADANEKALLKDLSKTFDHKVTAYNPEEVIEKTAGKLSETRRLKKLLEKHPGKWKQYQALRSRKFLDEIEVVDDAGFRNVDFGKLDTFLKADKGEMAEVFGKTFREDAQLLADIAQLRKVPKSVSSGLTSALKEVESTPSLLLWRAMFARPLSRLGLITTSTLKLDRQAARKATAKLLANPKLLRKAMNLYRKNEPWGKWASFAKTIGAAELGRAAEDNE